MSEDTPFQVEVADVAHVAVLGDPAFRLFRGGDVIPLVLDALRPFGASLRDLRVEASSPLPAEHSITCGLGGGGMVRFRLDSVEILASAVRVLNSEFIELVRAVFQVLGSERRHVETQTLSLALHGRLGTGHSTAELLGQFLGERMPIQAGRVRGISFAFPAAGSEGLVTLEESLRIPNGTYLRVASSFRGDVEPPDAYIRGRALVQELFRSLRLEVLWFV